MVSDEFLEERLRAAIRQFWTTRERQARKQGASTGSKDTGARAAVTGGAQMDGFVALIRDLLLDAGLQEAQVFCKNSLELPGWYRPEKKWDLLVVVSNEIICAMEFKSQVGSFGNNYNNRTEEAVGSAVDLWAAFREGAFRPSRPPWLGYMMLLEEASESTRPVGNREPHFRVFDEFKGKSYAERYEILLTKLIRERFYAAACFLMSSPSGGANGEYREPSEELSFRNFCVSLLGHVSAVVGRRACKRD